MKILTATLSLLAFQSSVANEFDDDIVLISSDNATYVPTYADTPAPSPGDSTYSPTVADDTYAPTIVEEGTYFPTAEDETYSPTIVDNENTNAPTVSDDNATIVEEDNNYITPAPSVEDNATPAPSGAEDDATPAPSSRNENTPAPTEGDDYVTVEEIDDAYSMDYTVSSVDKEMSSAAIRGAATLVIGVGCVAYYLF